MDKPITCVATNVQRGNQRFPVSDDRPPLKKWRCEFTALSHVYNLYLVACSDAIYIYQPSFPDQTLPTQPAGILNPPISRPGLGFYIDPNNPHSINRLHVDFLGHDEIVLVSCDDGDVIVYRTAAIQHAIENQQALSNDIDDITRELYLRPFFHKNVEDTAWGLAVHRQGRLIAISANTHKVTVVEFALAEPSSSSSETSQDVVDDDISFNGRLDLGEYRLITLLAESNIPSVSFDNTGADSSGRWLFSNCISGRTTLWDLRRPTSRARNIELRSCLDPRKQGVATGNPCKCRQFKHAAWGAMFVDPQCCHTSDNMDHACGVKPDSSALGFLDTTNSSPPGNYRAQTGYTDGDGSVSAAYVSGLWAEGNESEEIVINEVLDDVSGLDDDSELDDDFEELDDDSEEEGLFVTELESPVGGASSVPTAVILNEFCYFAPPERARLEQRIDAQKYLYCQMDCSENPLPLSVIVTKDDVCLLQPQPLPAATSTMGPVIFMRKPLYPITSVKRPSAHDRNNYSLQIPELGIFLVASSGGRCAVFSLTQTTEQLRSGNSRPVYAFRRDYIVPFAEQEWSRGVVPHNKPLVGIAAGPVQGSLDRVAGEEDDEGEKGGQSRNVADRKWRLFILYRDHTVLTYELGRRRKEDSPSLADLVV